jgi:flagellar biosynthetic protein FliR
MLDLGVLTLNWLQSMLLPLTRLTAFFLVAPLFSQSAGTGRIRVIYSAVLCMVVMPVFPSSLSNPGLPYGEPNLLLVLSEALIGVSMGLALQFVNAAVVTAGEQISMSVGISFAQSFDPTLGSTPILSQFLNLLALLVFLTAGGHTIMISMITESVRAMPPGEFRLVDIPSLLEFSIIIFKGAALLAAPLLLALLAVNLGVGALSRATPSLNVFAVGFAVSLLVGFGLLFVLMPAIAERIIELWQQAGAYIRPRLLGEA